MRAGLRRRLADRACRALLAILPPSLASWGWAVRCEVASIPDDSKALLFALDSLFGLMPRAVASRLPQLFMLLIRYGGCFRGGTITMTIAHALTRRPRTLGIVCAVCAVALGLLYLALAGAPARYLAINVAALAIGLAVLAMPGRLATAGQQWAGAASAAGAIALLATALVGADVDGAARWVRLSGFVIQPSLILLPVMLVAFSRSRSTLATASIVAAAAAMAVQPDRAMAGMLVLSLAAIATLRRDTHVLVALAASVASFAVTLARADTLPTSPYVDQIVYSSFDIHAVAGMAVWVGLATLLVPALVGWHRDAGNRAVYAAFGAAWTGAIVAAAIGNYPTPIVGYGGSAIIGYALSLLALPRLAGAHAGAVPQASDEMDSPLSDRHLRVELA
ncbi:hypothetical protein [Sphingobium olei]